MAISNRGGVRDGVAETDLVKAALRGALTGKQLGVDAIKREAVDNGEEISAQFAKLFLVLGLFAIATGGLLILLIFTMLAAERRYEMGMTRAVGAQRSQLVQQFVAEGAGYALLSGLIGAALGVGAAVGIARVMSGLFGQYVPIQAHVEPRSLLVAYCLGVVITFAAVVASSWKISRLNVVAAVRDLPDVSSPKRQRGVLVWSGLLLLAGALLMLAGQSAGEAVPLYLGLSLLPFGAGLLVRFFGAAGRPVLTLVGLAVLGLWLLPRRVEEAIFGDLHRGVELFFLSGILMVVGATIVIVQNCDVLLAGVSRLGGLFRSKLPAVRMAVAYPGATWGRTGMTIAMFSLIVFSLVMIATVSKNVDGLLLGDDANAGWDVRVDAMSANPLADFRGTLQAKGVDTSSFTAIGVTTRPNPNASQLRLAGTGAWKTWSVVGMDEGYIRDSKLTFQDRAAGYQTDADVIEALATEPDVAVIDSFALPGSDDRGNDAAFKLDGFTREHGAFAPITVELADPEGAAPHPVRIIGVIDSKLPTLFGLFANQRTIGGIYPEAVLTSYSIALKDPGHADSVAKGIEAALLQNGVQATAIRDELKESQRQATGFLYLIEGFMGLGLLVGMAAVGVVAFRAVVERRQQIGVLRAIGYQRGTVALSFLIETAFVVGLGLLSGTVLGLILARNLFTSDAIEASTDGAGFMVPVPLVSAILVATMVVALLMTWAPSRQAARIAPAEALRYE
ncbi:MAG: FtsX-like permease family protein [Chloroflexota bacterium]|nr:FtsX-like permease family protein [Chloroflexota bacterium]